MIPLVTIHATLKTWVSRLAGINVNVCVFQNEPRPRHNGAIAILSWVAMAGLGSDDIRYTETVAVGTALLATSTPSSVAPQTISGTALDGSIGAGAIDPPRPASITFNTHADWIAGDVTVTGVDDLGAVASDTIPVPVGGGAEVSGTVTFASVVTIEMPAAGGTGGRFTAGIPLAESPATLTLRKCSVQVSIETLDQTPDVNAFAYLERLRGRIYGPSSVALLQTAGLGLIDMDDSQQRDYPVDKRWISRALATVRFNQSDISIDTQGTAEPIESVDVTSTITDIDDSVLPASQQWDHKVIPDGTET